MQNKKFIVILLALVFIMGFVGLYFFIIGGLSKDDNKSSEEGVVCNFASDKDVIDELFKSKNTEICKCVKDEKTQKECWGYLDLDFYSQALSELNIDLCKKIKETQKKDLCEKNVKIGLGTREKSARTHIADIYVLSANVQNVNKYEELIKTYPEDTEYLMQLSLAYGAKSIENREFEKEVRDREYFNKSLATLGEVEKNKNKDDVQLNRVKGYIYLQNFEFKEARQYLEKAIALSPSHFYLYITLAQILYQQNENKLAIQKAQRGLSLLENNTTVSENLRNELKVEFYSVMVGAYHQQNDSANEEKYKNIISDLMSLIKK